MTRQQLSDALAMAKRGEGDVTSLTPLIGFSLPDFPQTCVSLSCLAVLIRWQCITLAGTIDEAALNEIWQARRKIIVV